MHDVLRQRVMRRLETLPEAQIYQVLDYIEFLESRYARDLQVEASGLQRFAEGLEDRLRKKAVSPQTLREAFQLIAAADRVLSSVSTAGRQIISELGSLADTPEDGRTSGSRSEVGSRGTESGHPPTPPQGPTPPGSGGRADPARRGPGRAGTP